MRLTINNLKHMIEQYDTWPHKGDVYTCALLNNAREIAKKLLEFKQGDQEGHIVPTLETLEDRIKETIEDCLSDIGELEAAINKAESNRQFDEIVSLSQELRIKKAILAQIYKIRN